MQASPVVHRSREGCLPCRRSHVKCDEQRPTCTRCYHKNKTCSYGIQLIWPDQSKAKGISHGRQKLQPFSSFSVPRSNAEQISLPPGDFYQYGTHFLNTNAADIEEHSRTAIPKPERKAAVKPNDFQLFQRPSRIQLPDYDETLMSFYDRVICSTATIEDSAKGNPFRGVLMPLALESVPVSNAILAVSAKVMTLRQPLYHEKALIYHSRALKHLVHTIDKISESDGSLFEACAVSVLLCWFEISCDNHGIWASHLTGLMHLLAIRERNVVASNLPHFLADYFLFHFIVARTVLNLESIEKDVKKYAAQTTGASSPRQMEISHRSSTGLDIRQYLSSLDASDMTVTLLQWMKPVDLHEINTYTGLSGGLLLLINRITDLESPSDKKQIADHDREALKIKAVLENLCQYAPRNLLVQTTLQVSTSAEIYRLGCLLYLHQRVTSIRARIAMRTTSLTPLFSEPQVLDLACRTLTYLEDNPPLLKTVANRLWPLFMAGCSANDELLRIRVLGLFKRIENDKRFWNVAPARMLIEKIWRHHDLCTNEPVVSLRKYKTSQADVESANIDEEKCCEWDRIMHLMESFKWSLT